VKRIRYAGGSFVTGDGIADAVLDYAAELANAGKAAKLDVPTVDLEQRSELVSLVIGPASQLLAEPVAAHRELRDEVFVTNVRRRTRVLRYKSGTFEGGDSASSETPEGP
jgi:hypothetical protein